MLNIRDEKEHHIKKNTFLYRIDLPGIEYRNH